MFVFLVVFCGDGGFGWTFLKVTAKRNAIIVRTFFRFLVKRRWIKMVLSASGFVQETATVSSYSASRWFEGNIDAPMGSVIAKTCFERRVFCFLQLQDGRILTGHIDGTLQVSDLLSLDFCRAGDVIIRAHPSPVNAIVQLRDGRVVSSSSFSIYMKLWDMDSLTCLKRIEMPELSLMSIHNVRSLVELSDGTLLREKSDLHPQLGNGQPITTLDVWDLATGWCLSSIILLAGGVYAFRKNFTAPKLRAVAVLLLGNAVRCCVVGVPTDDGGVPSQPDRTLCRCELRAAAGGRTPRVRVVSDSEGLGCSIRTLSGNTVRSSLWS